MNKKEWARVLLKSVAHTAKKEAVAVKLLLKADLKKGNSLIGNGQEKK